MEPLQSKTIIRPGRRIYGAVVGIAIVDRKFPRPIGDMGNAGSYSFPVMYDIVRTDDNAPGRSVAATNELFTPLYESCMRLVENGATVVTTTCGYAALLQERLASELPVPFAASSLVQIPSVLAVTPPRKSLGILAARPLTEESFCGTGVTGDAIQRLRVINLRRAAGFSLPVLDAPGREPLHLEAATADIVQLCKDTLDTDPSIAGFVSECANMGPYSAAIQNATNLPVWDGISLVHWLHAAAHNLRT